MKRPEAEDTRQAQQAQQAQRAQGARQTQQAPQPQRVAIPALGPSLDDETGSHFGRAPHFCVAQLESSAIQWISNDASTATNGAGSGAAQAIIDAGANVVVARRIGPKARTVLEAADVELYEADGETVREVLERFRAGAREPLRE